jgi:hypothetical protein
MHLVIATIAIIAHIVVVVVVVVVIGGKHIRLGIGWRDDFPPHIACVDHDVGVAQEQDVFHACRGVQSTTSTASQHKEQRLPWISRRGNASKDPASHVHMSESSSQLREGSGRTFLKWHGGADGDPDEGLVSNTPQNRQNSAANCSASYLPFDQSPSGEVTAMRWGLDQRCNNETFLLLPSLSASVHSILLLPLLPPPLLFVFMYSLTE